MFHLLQIHNIHRNFWIDRARSGRHFEKIHYSGLVVQEATAATAGSSSSSMSTGQLQLQASSKGTEVSEGTPQTDNDLFR